jgi:hypothetical protein
MTASFIVRGLSLRQWRHIVFSVSAIMRLLFLR